VAARRILKDPGYPFAGAHAHHDQSCIVSIGMRLQRRTTGRACSGAATKARLVSPRRKKEEGGRKTKLIRELETPRRGHGAARVCPCRVAPPGKNGPRQLAPQFLGLRHQDARTSRAEINYLAMQRLWSMESRPTKGNVKSETSVHPPTMSDSRIVRHSAATQISSSTHTPRNKGRC